MTGPDDEDFEDTGPAVQERDLETPAEDAAEQATPANPAEQLPEVPGPDEASEWDVIEQAQVVDLDEDYPDR